MKVVLEALRGRWRVHALNQSTLGNSRRLLAPYPTSGGSPELPFRIPGITKAIALT